MGIGGSKQCEGGNFTRRLTRSSTRSGIGFLNLFDCVEFDELRGSKPLFFDTMLSIQDSRDYAEISKLKMLSGFYNRSITLLKIPEICQLLVKLKF